MIVTPEIKLYRAMIDGVIKDSLGAPIGDLPDYPEGGDTDSPEYRTIKRRRRSMMEEESWRIQAKHDAMSLWMDRLYPICYDMPVNGLRSQLAWMWVEIEQDPSMSKFFISQVNPRAGHEKRGGMKTGTKKRAKSNNEQQDDMFCARWERFNNDEA